MRTDCPDLALRETARCGHVAPLPAPAHEPEVARRKDSLAAHPLDWDEAVRAAAARLSETWIQPDTKHHPVVRGLAQQLAALLCAYGELPGEADRMHPPR